MPLSNPSNQDTFDRDATLRSVGAKYPVAVSDIGFRLNNQGFSDRDSSIKTIAPHPIKTIAPYPIKTIAPYPIKTIKASPIKMPPFGQ